MKVIGLDISSGYATAFLLESVPSNFKEFLNSPEFTPFEVKPVKADLDGLIALKADCIVLEPTGYHLERVFCGYFEAHNQPYRRATGKRVASFRDTHGIPKTDDNDAFSLAAFGLTFWEDSKAFIPKTELEDLRQLWLQRHGLAKTQTRFINRLRQQLAHEFPEVAEKDWERRWGEQPYGLIRWLSGEHLEKRVLTRYENAHNATIGSGVGNYSRSIADHLNRIQRQMQAIEQDIDQFLTQERFAAYTAAMQRLGFSQMLQAIWLTRIYPFSRFLDDDGRTIEVKRLSKRGKMCTYNLSLSQFKAAIGAGMIENSSGIRQPRSKAQESRKWRGRTTKKKGQRDSRAEAPMGCRFSRQSFFLWSLNQVETGNAGKHELGLKLVEKRNALKEDGKNLYQRSGNLQGFAARLLFKELKRELSK